jgi:hypothetical protein
MKQATLLLLLLPLLTTAQDSLWTETPVIKDAATTPITVGQEITITGGRLKAIKFYKNETAGNYTITLWQQSNGASLFSQQYRSTTIGWQKITIDLALEPGTYVIGVKFPNGKYVYTNGLNPRTRGKLTGTAGLLGWNVDKPSNRYTASFFVDVVIAQDIPRKPLIVNAGKDTTASWPADSIKVLANISGDEVKYTWEVLNQWNGVAVTGLTTLTPVVKFTEPDSGVQMILTGTDKWGNVSWHGVNVSVMPDFEPYVKRMGELIMNEVRFEMVRKWKAGE